MSQVINNGVPWAKYVIISCSIISTTQKAKNVGFTSSQNHVFFVRCSSLIAVLNEIKMKFDLKSLSPRVSAFLVPEQFFWMLLALLADTIFFLASPCPAKGTSCNIFLFCHASDRKF